MEEARKFFPHDLLTFDSLDSTSDAAEQQLDAPRIMHCIDFVVISYPTLTGARRGSGRRLFDIPWARIVLDEGTSIVNDATLVFEACAGLRASRRIFISGTPMPNVRATEINAILSFFGCDEEVMIPKTALLFDAEGGEDSEDHAALERRQRILEHCRHVLRTYCLSVESVEDDGSELALPSQVAALRAHKTAIHWVTLSPEERAIYDEERRKWQADPDLRNHMKWFTRLQQVRSFLFTMGCVVCVCVQTTHGDRSATRPTFSPIHPWAKTRIAL
jgi:Superfamily II DNA/RNA helicases, SNF2 family